MSDFIFDFDFIAEMEMNDWADEAMEAKAIYSRAGLEREYDQGEIMNSWAQ